MPRLPHNLISQATLFDALWKFPMAKNVQAPSELRIAALEEKKAMYRDLRAVGNGTPWEDRGSSNLVTAFFSTAIQSMFRPLRLLHAIRRPETTGDAVGFLVGCGIFWGISAIVHNYIWLMWHVEPFVDANSDSYQLDHGLYWFGAGLQFLLCPAALFLGTKLLTKFFNQMVATEFKGRGSAVLTFNVFAYCLGPSILAPIPVAGPILALVWILVLLVVAGTGRLYLSTAGVVIAVIISFLGVAALTVGAFFAGDFLWYKLPTGGAIQRNEGYF